MKSKKPAAPAKKSKSPDWNRLADRRLARLISSAEAESGLRKLGPKARPWQVQLRLIGSATMKQLNAAYRGKDYATDVLSFPAPEVFRREMGILGELVICLPTLKAQAKAEKHPPEVELNVLLAHGLLHLLGLDHERGAKEAATQRRWENRLLEAAFGKKFAGLIERNNSSIKGHE